MEDIVEFAGRAFARARRTRIGACISVVSCEIVAASTFFTRKPVASRASGDIVSFNADTVSGNMIVDTEGTPDRIDTNTVSGDLTVRFEPGTGARYRINTVGGTVLLDDVTMKGLLG